MIVETFLTKWLLDGSNAKKETKSLEDNFESLKHTVESLRDIEIFKVAMEWGHKLIESLEGVGDAAEHLQNMAFAAGVSAEELQKLQYSASQAGVSSDAVTTSISKLSRSLEDAKKGSKEAVAEFAELGIPPERLASFKNGADALYAVSNGISRMDNPTKRIQLSMALLGRSSAGAVKWLAQGEKGIKGVGEEGKKLGAIVSEDDLDVLATTADEVSSIWAIVKGFTATLLTGFAPSIKQVVGVLKEWWLANRAVIQLRVKEWIYDFLFAIGYLSGAIEDIIGWFVAWAKAHRYIGLYALELARTMRDLLAGAIQSVVGAISDFMAKHPELIQSLKTWAITIGLAIEAYQFLIFWQGLSMTGMGLWGGAIAKLKDVMTTFALRAMYMGDALMAINLQTVAIVATVGILIGLIEEIWTLLHGGKFEDTWFGKLLGGGKLAKSVGDIGSLFGEKSDTFEVGPDGKPRPKTSSGSSSGRPMQMLQAANNFQGLHQMASSMDTSNGVPAALASNPMASFPAPNVDNTINATFNVTIPPGTQPEQAKQMLLDAVQQAQKAQLRAAQSAVQSPIKH